MTSRSGWKALRRRGLFTALFGALALVGMLPMGTAAAQQAEPPHREMELQRYRDAVRRHFVLKEYEELLELTEQYGHLYPEDRGTEFYRTQAEIRIQEAEKEIPFERLEDREFKIPGADSGQPSLLDELRNGTGSESGLSGTAGLTVEPGSDSQIAMGTGPETQNLQSPFERPVPLEAGEDSSAGELDFTTPDRAGEPEEAPVRGPIEPEPRSPALPPSPEQTGAVEEAESDSDGSPLPLILGGSVLVLGAVAAFLLIGMARRGKRDDAVPEAAPVASGPEPAAPPLFNFEDAEASDLGSGSEFDNFEAPEAFGETGTVQEDHAAEAGRSRPVFEDAPAGTEPPAALGETRGTEEVNQEISDLLFAPGESAEDSVFGSGSDAVVEPPPPLGETQTEETAFGASGEDTSDLVQIPDDSESVEAASDVDALFADFSSPERESGADSEERSGSAPAAREPEPSAETSADELSSIDLFGDDPSAQTVEVPGQGQEHGGPSDSDATSSVDMNEVDALITESGGGSSSGEVDFSEPAGEEPAPSDSIEIPFAMEDPFTNLSGKSEESQAPEDDQTAFNTSTAETMAAHGADTGVEERELLQVIEEGDGETRVGDAGGDDVWSGLGTGHAEAPPQEKAPAPEDEVQSFREDETAAFEIEMGGETGQPPTSEASPQVANPEAETVVPEGRESSSSGQLPDDPFERERQRGQQAVEVEDWNKAVYHLSIAASLKPEANDVRDELRRARKMKKEQQTG